MPVVLGNLTRRQFSRGLGASAAALLIPSTRTTQAHATGYAFLSAESRNTLHVFAVSGTQWRPLQALSARSPAHLITHPTLPVLYVVHGVDLWDHLPRGAVSAYRIAPRTGLLTLQNTQPLSLSATNPRHAAVRNDGRQMLVAASRGGIYNLLPLADDGSLKSPSIIRKELGWGDGAALRTASPGEVVFRPDGRMAVSADAGQQSISLFAVEEDALSLVHRARANTGVGLSGVAFSPWSGCIYALNGTVGLIGVYRVQGTRLADCGVYRHPFPGATQMAIHPSGRFLATASAGTVTLQSIDHHDGSLTVSTVQPSKPLETLAFAGNGFHLLGTAASSGEIVVWPFNLASGTFGHTETVARVRGASSILFRPA